MTKWQKLTAGIALLAAGVLLYLVGPEAARELATLLAGSSIPILGNRQEVPK